MHTSTASKPLAPNVGGACRCHRLGWWLKKPTSLSDSPQTRRQSVLPSRLLKTFRTGNLKLQPTQARRKIQNSLVQTVKRVPPFVPSAVMDEAPSEIGRAH